MQTGVRIEAFGQGSYFLPTLEKSSTVGEVLGALGVAVQGRRVARNGHAADLGSSVMEGDEVTVVPRVQGG